MGRGVAKDAAKGVVLLKYLLKRPLSGYDEVGIHETRGIGTKQSTSDAMYAGIGSCRCWSCSGLGQVSALYRFGAGITADSYKALDYYKRGAQSGDPEAATALGIIYRDGDGTKVSYQDSFRWFSRASELGSVEGQYHLGTFYLDGNGVDRDLERGKKLIIRASNQGLADAQNRLGEIYQAQGNSESALKKAYNLFLKASKQNQP